jgi:hypothetical protein
VAFLQFFLRKDGSPMREITEHSEQMPSLVWSRKEIEVRTWTSQYEDEADTPLLLPEVKIKTMTRCKIW